ncbi:DNA-binding transcriptional regulator [Derxia lacustris]|uniref:DNA-binding transcriptional regulator n=1 Tax=Derxia lacustris TaxID=764842 RepID=UPI001F38DFBB|nr:DNA-binding transcriptional regulator [Derxia lacustris]
MISGDANDYATVRGLVRGLDLLRALNTFEGGRCTLADLVRETGLHRTTVRRLLETLIAEQYVRRSESDGRYCLALRVRSLSEGFTDDDWISSLAAPALAELLTAVLWPSDVSTPQGARMVIRESTHRFSQLSFHRAMVGQSMPMLTTAAGRAYLAHCPPDVLDSLLALMRDQDDEQARLARDERFVARLLERTRERGYGANDAEWDAQRKIGAIALPVMHQGRPLGSLNVVYLARALKSDEAARRHLPALRHAVQRVEAQLAADDGGAGAGDSR